MWAGARSLLPNRKPENKTVEPDVTKPAPNDRRFASSRAAPIIERAPLPMVEVEGPTHTVCFVNPAFCRLVGKAREELIGKNFCDIVRNGDACSALLDRIYQTGEHQTLVEVDHSASEPTYWLYAMWPALDEATDRRERVVIQMTKAAHARQDLAAVNEALLISGLREHELRDEAEKSKVRLEAEIASRIIAEAALRDINDKLGVATDTAERANRAKDQLLATISHELRLPLTPVLLAAAALQEDRRLTEDVLQVLAMIERNITLEARLVDDLLDVTKVAHGKLLLRPERCDAHFLIGLAVEIVSDEAAVKGVTVERNLTAPRSEIVADPARFQQVIWNLVRNAIKFTPRGGRVSVRTSNGPVTEKGYSLFIEVVDTGVGIDPAGLKRIFLPFEQGSHGGDHHFGGVGLGLAIARAVVLLHEGTIMAKSAGVNQGATFVVELPGAVPSDAAAPTARAPDAAATAVPGNSRALRLLVVDDHVATLQALSVILRRDGHHVTTAASIAEALIAATGANFDLVISDLGLPDGTGNELMEKLHRTYGLRGIALTGYGMDEDLARSKAAGFVRHLVKPVALADLRRAIASVEHAQT